MKEFKEIPFEEYKQIEAINYSLLKRVADSGPLYSLEGSRESDAMNLGSVVDDLLLNGNISKYIVLEDDPPTAMTLDLANLVIDKCIKQLISFKQLLELDNKEDFIFEVIKENDLWSKNTDIIRKGKYKDNLKFFNYIQTKLSALDNKIVLSPDQWSKANELVNILKTHEYTKDIIGVGINQLTHVFTIDGERYKIRLDKVIIDDENKTITPYDLKTGYDKAHKFEKNFYMLRYYLQQSLYTIGILHFASKFYPGYTIEPFKFIYISTTEHNPYPIIYKMSEEWADLGWNGFIMNGRKYKGIEQLVKELNYYKESGCNIPMEVHECNGVMDMPLPY